ncbi:hypothetical protein ACEQ8H_003892 [Pleosporales sp. CAS-2024a]
MPGLAMESSQFDTSASRQRVKVEDDTLGLDEETYVPRPPLPKPFVCMRNLADLMKDLDNEVIDVSPEYQREVVWTADRMTGLVDSLMENFYIPPIILNKRTPTEKAKPAVHVCVDGKQRLSAVRAFFKGMIPCHDANKEKWWFCDTPGSRCKKVLPEESQQMFLRKEFVTYEFKDLLPEQEEDLFARVQMGLSLNLAEKMRASTGPWQELAKLFVEDFPTIYSLMKDRARAKDFQLTLACFSQIVEVLHPSAADGVPTLKTNYKALPKLLSNQGAVDDALKSHLASVWNTFGDLVTMDSNVFTNTEKYLSGVQTFAPAEMVAVTVLISMYSDTRDKRSLLGDIKAMREAIREVFADIRTNQRFWAFIWSYLNDVEATSPPAHATVMTTGKRGSPIITEARQPRRQRTDHGSTGAIAIEEPSSQMTANSYPSESQSGLILAQPARHGAGQAQYDGMVRQSLASSTTASTREVSIPARPVASLQPRRSSQMLSTPKSVVTGAGVPPVSSSRLQTPTKKPGSLKFGRGAYSPMDTGVQWAGEWRSMTPPREQRLEEDAPRKDSLRWNVPQQDEIVDLTSDTEQERQKLLSSFRGTKRAADGNNRS